MGKILSNKEWLKWKGDFFWIKHSSIITDELSRNNTHADIILKWAEKKCTGWVFLSEGYWMFENKSDAAIVKSAIIAGVFSQDMGEVNKE